MLARPLSPSFLETYSPSTSSMGCNALSIVISFLVLWSIYLSSALVHLWKGPEYLTSGTAQVFIPLIRFLDESFVSDSFLILLIYSCWILPFISTFLIVSASRMPNYLQVSIFVSVLILPWFGSSIPAVICHLPLFITSISHFAMPNSISISWLYILTACIRVSSSF